jgi:hypothetical protein
VRRTDREINVGLALTKNDVLSIEPGRHDCGDEELRTIGVRAGIGHGEKARLGML